MNWGKIQAGGGGAAGDGLRGQRLGRMQGNAQVYERGRAEGGGPRGEDLEPDATHSGDLKRGSRVNSDAGGRHAGHGLADGHGGDWLGAEAADDSGAH